MLYGCVYDPPHASFAIYNNSISPVYVCVTCTDSLPLDPKLYLYDDVEYTKNLKQVLKQNPFDPPDYRINANSNGYFRIGGTPKDPELYCEDKKIRLFFITQSTMRTKQWEEIYKKQLYEKKIVLTEKQLRDQGWKYTYNFILRI